MISIDIKVTNPRNGLSKTIVADMYSEQDFVKTVNTYEAAGFAVEVFYGARYGL